MANEMRENTNERRTLKEWFEQEDFQDSLLDQFPNAAAVLKRDGVDRRTFLKLMGASLAAAGLSGCVRATSPGEEIIPYVRVPEEVIPGNPVHFATTSVLGGYGVGVVLETHEGRPHRLEGNPNHPASLGGADIITQASILELYNPERATLISGEGTFQSWQNFRLAVRDVMTDFEGNGGEGLRILTETVTSPTLAAQMETLLEQYPNAVWHQYEPINRDNVYAGAMLAFGQMVNTVYNFAAADIVLTLDGDFLTPSMPGNLAYANDFAAKRHIRSGTDSMNRLYAVESTPTNTGTFADHRQAVKAGEVELFARALAAELGVAGVSAPSDAPWDGNFLSAVADDLQSAGSAGVVVVGPQQTPATHALAHAINAQLGSEGVAYTEPVEANPMMQGESLATLVNDMNAGNVEALFILEGNPVYNTPADIDFAAALENVPFTVQHSLYNDETAALTTWHIPAAHYLEAWSDARAFDGTASLVQPPIGPLYERVRSSHEVVAAILGDNRTAYDIVRATWQDAASGDFELFWRRALHDGVVADTTPDPITPAVSSLDLGAAPSVSGTEIIFRQSPTVWDGRYGYNAWLQELPNPITSVSWDNHALVSPDTAAALGLSIDDLIEVSYEGNSMRIPVVIVNGHPDDSVTVYLGYGRGIDAGFENGFDFSAYQLQTSDALYFGSGADIRRVGTYPLAIVRGELQVDDIDAVYYGTFEEFQTTPDFIDTFDKVGKEADLLGNYDYDNHSWGMSIDLTTCIGCNACMIACQTENNIPTVGKESVGVGRDMYWIRIDAYPADGRGSGTMSYQPVPCMHCEKAPCEQVCPVQATVHSSEGLNQMIYNRCVGTRYCSANCPYGVRRFNFEDYVDPALTLIEVRNPDVSVRVEGVMEKCTYCVQRIKAVRIEAKKVDRDIEDGEIVTACQSACPTNAIVFGDLNNPDAQVTQLREQPHTYGLLAELNTQPRTTYLARINNPNAAL